MLILNKGCLCLLAGTMLSVMVIQNAYAEEEDRLNKNAEATVTHANHFPYLGGEVVMELQDEFTADSDDSETDGYNNMFYRTEVAPVLRLGENFFIDGVAVFENIQDRDPGDDNYFDNEGAFIEELKLEYEKGPWAAWVGKFNPSFGIAWDFGRGIWSEDFAEDYEITEKIGVGASYTFENEQIGAHTFSANTYFADTTFLSGSAITKRDKLNKSDGGVSNTEDFSSFVLSLDGENLAGVENLYYKLGYRNQGEGDADSGTNNETGYVVTLGHSVPVSDRINLDGLVEFADIHNFEGGADDNRYFTASLISMFDEKWNVTLGYTSRNINVRNGSDIDDHLFQISGGYDFGQGTTFEIGWKNTEEDSVDTNIVGGLIRHKFEF